MDEEPVGGIGARTEHAADPRFVPLLEAFRERETEVSELRGELDCLREREIPELQQELANLREAHRQQGITNLQEAQRQTAELERQIELHRQQERKVSELYQQIESLRRQLQVARDNEAQVPELHREISLLRDRERQIPELRLRLTAALAANGAAEASAQALLSSTSWKVTAPIRWLLDLLRGNQR